MEDKKILITSYEHADIDGTACGYAYAEFLKNKNIDAKVGFFKNVQTEAQYVIDKFHIKLENGEALIKERKEIIFLDASKILRLPKQIKPEQVIEIIDHRHSENLENFPNAKTQIELVGSCATLIGEKFKKENMKISTNSATLLYSAIISNTLNFKAKSTTNKDKIMAEWLKNQINLPENYIHEMFKFKSTFKKPIKQIILEDLKEYNIKNETIGIGEVEIINVNKLIKNNLTEIKTALIDIKKEKEFQHMFLNCLDIEHDFTKMIAVEESTKKIITSALNIAFKEEVATIKRLVGRKEIIPALEK